MNASMSSRSSRDGDFGRGRSSQDGGAFEDGEPGEEGIFDRFAAWWHNLTADTPPDSPSSTVASSANGAAFANGGGSGATPTSAYRPRQASPAGSASASGRPGGSTTIIEAGPDAPPGCIGIFTAAQAVVAQRKFLKLAKPRAGSFKNLDRLQLPSDAAAAAEAPSPAPAPAPIAAACACETVDPTTFLVRSQNYMKDRLKAPANEALYRLVGVDMYSFDTKIWHIAQAVELPRPPTLGPGALALPPDQRLPPLLIINLLLPMYPPSVWGGTNDGPGHSLVYYFTLPEGWEPEQVENKAALALAQRFFADGEEFDGQPTRDRLKLLPRFVNVEEWAEQGPLSGAEVRLLRSYNAKPLLTRPQQRFYAAPDGSYVEIDLDVHSYAYVARRAFQGFIPRLAPVVFDNAFVLQGNRAEELPEAVLAAVRVHRVDFTKSRPFPGDAVPGKSGSGSGAPPSPMARPGGGGAAATFGA